MTVVVAVKKEGRIVIGADSLTSYGSHMKVSGEHKENSDKIITFADSYIGLAGSAAWRLVFKDHFSAAEAAPDLTSVGSIFSVLRDFHKVLLDKYHLQNSASNGNLSSARFDGIVVNRHGIFEFDGDRAVVQFAQFIAVGSGSHFAMGAMKALYNSSASAEEIARVGLEAACEFDPGSGGPIMLKTVALKASPKVRKNASRIKVRERKFKIAA